MGREVEPWRFCQAACPHAARENAIATIKTTVIQLVTFHEIIFSSIAAPLLKVKGVSLLSRLKLAAVQWFKGRPGEARVESEI
jgi:hypothetical protein